MSLARSNDAVPPPSERVGLKTWILLTIGYLACVVVATYPHVLSMTKGLPGSLYDPLQHLWTMKWYRTCLLEWRSPIVCPELQFPVGAPLGNFSPLQFQAVLYFPLSFFFDDVVCFNLIWLTGIVTTGLGTFLLAWYVLRDRRCAALGGMMAMLSGSMIAHAHAHLELIFVGCFPLFLVCWMRLVDAPNRRRLAEAAGSYLLVALCAAYYVVLATIPAALYLLWKGVGAVRQRKWPWFRSRVGWMLGFGAIALPSLVLVFGNQLWAKLNGYSVSRPLEEFNVFGTPLWSYLIPANSNPLGALLPVDIYAAPSMKPEVGEKISYLGVVSIFLIFYAATTNARFHQRGYWWTLLAALILLSNGSYWDLGAYQIPLPALWLKKHVFLFDLIRVPARFNLFAGVVAGVIAAAGLKAWLAVVPRRSVRLTGILLLSGVALFDLANPSFPTAAIPPIPTAYDYIRRNDPDAGLLEVPHWASSGGSSFASLSGYWQSIHRLRTDSGYSGHQNVKFDNRVVYNSPFQIEALAQPSWLAQAYDTTIGIVNHVDLMDYLWLYLHANRFRYLVLHEWAALECGEDGPENLARLKDLIASARVFEENGVSVFDRKKLPKPAHAVLVPTDGWRPGWYEKPARFTDQEAKLLLYNPDPDRTLKFAFEASAFPHARTVRLLADGQELASWRVGWGSLQLYLSPAIRLPAGVQELVLESDGQTRPSRRQQANAWDRSPYSLRVGGIALIDAETHDRLSLPPPPQLAEQTEADPDRSSPTLDETPSVRR